MTEKEKWTLRGEAYGVVYNESMTLVRKEIVPVPEEIVEQQMRIISRWANDDPSYRKMLSTEERAIFTTEKGNEVVVSPRYVGSRLGSNDDGKGNTICALFYNGQYVALAFYNEAEKTVIAHEY